MKLILVLALVEGSVSFAHADSFTFRYICNEKGKAYPLLVDGDRKEFIYRGNTYKTTEFSSDGGECPRFGWRVSGYGKIFDFCTATKGYADFVLDGSNVECSQEQ